MTKNLEKQNLIAKKNYSKNNIKSIIKIELKT